jgi:hypothetical protein
VATKRTGFYHGSVNELPIGTVLHGGRRSGPVEDLLEAYGPSSIRYTDVFMSVRPEDVYASLPAVDVRFVYEVEPIGVVKGPFDSGWYQEIAGEAARRDALRRNLVKIPRFAAMADKYWRGEPSPTPGAPEYITPEARIIGVVQAPACNVTRVSELRIDRRGMRPESLALVRKQRDRGERMRPIVVECYPGEQPFLADGRHRLQVATELGDKTIEAVVRVYDARAEVVSETPVTLEI